MEAPPNAFARDSSAVRAMKDITFGSIAGMVSKVFEHPFDLTKVRLQSQVLEATTRFDGPIDCLMKTWQYEGVRGLYRGLPAPIVGAMAENASLFLGYSEFQNLIKRINRQPLTEQPTLGQLALAGAGAGMVTSFLLTPIELVKCKMQVQMLARPRSVGAGVQALPGPISILVSVIRNDGVKGLWLGHTGTFIRETGGTAAWFWTKETVSRILVSKRLKRERGGAESDVEDRKVALTPSGNLDLKPWESALAGACAGASFNLALFPADSVKSAMQTEEELRAGRMAAVSNSSSSAASAAGRSSGIASVVPPKPTFYGTFRAMYKAQGIRGLYAGCGITVARSIPSSAIIFLIYDGLSKRFG